MVMQNTLLSPQWTPMLKVEDEALEPLLIAPTPPRWSLVPPSRDLSPLQPLFADMPRSLSTVKDDEEALADTSGTYYNDSMIDQRAAQQIDSEDEMEEKEDDEESGEQMRSMTRSKSTSHPPLFSTPAPRNGGARAESTSVRRGLRTRSTNQIHPYKFDKTKHTLATKSGKNARSSDIEDAVNTEIRGAQQTSTRKRAAKSKTCKKPSRPTTDSISRTRSTPLTSSSSPSPELIAPQDYIRKNTTLRTWLSGFDEAAETIALAKCPSISVLMVELHEAWDWYLIPQCQKIHYCTVVFPWLDQEKRIILREGRDAGYDTMVAEIERAAMWKKKNVVCDVKVIVHTNAA